MFRIPSVDRRTAIVAAFGVAWIVLLAGCQSVQPAVSELEDDALCDLTRDLFAVSMETAPIFESVDGACRVIEEVDAIDGTRVFADAECQTAVDVASIGWRTFCADNLLGDAHTRTWIGNPDAWTDRNPTITDHIETPWSAAHDVRLHLASANQTTLPRPFVKRVEYRRVDECALGMHIYRQDLGASDRKPLILIHGGGWKLRGFGAVAGIGTMAPHFTSRGYVVFAPFYRLIEDADGPPACHGAAGADLLADLDAAFAWVQEHGADYGARTDGPISVAGQSAGGHLAAYLATRHPSVIDRGLLLYPAPDLGFFAEQVQPGGLYDGRFEASQGLLVSFFDQPGVTEATELDLDDPELARNSFPPTIQQDPQRYPALEILHGNADTTVPVELSVRLCQALDPATAPSDAAYAAGGEALACGDAGSRLTVVDGANHILDLRCFSGRAAELLDRLSPQLDALCTAGSPEGEEIVRSTLEAAYARF